MYHKDSNLHIIRKIIPYKLYHTTTALSFKIAHMFPKISLFYRRHTANMPAKNSTTDSMSSIVLNI